MDVNVSQGMATYARSGEICNKPRYCKFTKESSGEFLFFKNRLRFDRIVDEFVTSLLLAHPVLREYIDTDDTSHACLCLCVCTTFHHSLSGVQVQVTFVKLAERWTLDIRRIFEISKLEYSGIYYSS